MAEREQIIEGINSVFKNENYALALWQGGSASFNRLDEWSDIDLMLIVEDGLEQQAMKQLETSLESEFGIEAKFEISPPHWPGMVQTFFQLKNTSPYLLIDFSILPQSAKEKFLEPEIHGEAVVLFDKKNIVAVAPLNKPELNNSLKLRVAKQKKRFEIFPTLVDKEIHRKNAVDAFVFYWSYTLAPLVEMLRIKHSPYHWNFGSRYLNKHLPIEIADKVQPLFFVKDLDDLIAKNKLAREWFYKAAKEAEDSLA